MPATGKPPQLTNLLPRDLLLQGAKGTTTIHFAAIAQEKRRPGYGRRLWHD